LTAEGDKPADTLSQNVHVLWHSLIWRLYYNGAEVY
jgi:hypothetical protein